MAAWRDLARQTEDLGYSCLFIPDHFGDQFGPLVALTVAAEATTTLRVGSLVFDNDYRHPVDLAKEIATLDLASEGRVEFGIGAGWMTSDYDEAGIPLDSPGVRVDRMIEGLAVMKGLWANEKFSFTGKHYELKDAQGLPRPHTAPHPPILIGGGARRVLTVAAREADIVGVNMDLRAGRVSQEMIDGARPERFDERLEWVRAAAGARFDSLDIQALTFFVMVVPNRQQVLEAMAPTMGMTPEVAGATPPALVGTVEEICEQLV